MKVRFLYDDNSNKGEMIAEIVSADFIETTHNAGVIEFAPANRSFNNFFISVSSAQKEQIFNNLFCTGCADIRQCGTVISEDDEEPHQFHVGTAYGLLRQCRDRKNDCLQNYCRFSLQVRIYQEKQGC